MIQDNKPVSFWQAVRSVAASAFGVQSQQNLKRDFQQPSPVVFLVVGVAFVALFVLGLTLLVSFL